MDVKLSGASTSPSLLWWAVDELNWRSAQEHKLTAMDSKSDTRTAWMSLGVHTVQGTIATMTGNSPPETISCLS